MAPSTTSPSHLTSARKESRLGSNSREVTPTIASKTKSDAHVSLTNLPFIMSCTDEFSQLATVFKSDLTNIRNLVTCSICDQLLYEPWTLGCGHTYCYSVSWSEAFV